LEEMGTALRACQKKRTENSKKKMSGQKSLQKLGGEEDALEDSVTRGKSDTQKKKG